MPGLVARESDLSVIGPMTRGAADLDLALSVIAGPQGERDGVAYRLDLPPPRHGALKDFRVLLFHEHPSLPVGQAVGTAIESLAQRLAKAGVNVARHSPLLPDLAESAALYMRLLMSAFAERWPREQYERAVAAAGSIKPDDKSLAAERARGTVMDHHQWAAAAGMRIKLQRQWRELFREFDVVVCPSMPMPAFAHDHSPSIPDRKMDIDGKLYPYFDSMIWPGIATLPGHPSTSAPIGLSDTGLPIGVQIVGPYLEDRTPIAFAGLMEREFEGFVPPPGYAG
jgi:amidase